MKSGLVLLLVASITGAGAISSGCGGDDFTTNNLTPAGGDSGKAGSAGAATSGGSGGGSAGGSGGSNSGSCTEALHCDGADLYSCSDGETTLIESCATAALCDPSAGECVPPSCDAGDHTCNDYALEGCSTDRTGYEVVDLCASAALCNPSAGICETPACDVGEYRCSGSLLEACSADRTEFIDVLDCGTSELCNQTTGECELACTPTAYQCNNATLLQCNEAGTSVGISEVCSTAALCNEALGQCDTPACAANQYDCDGASLRICNDDRTDFMDFDTCETPGLCVAATGICRDPECAQTDYECLGNLLRGCNDDRTAFEVEQTCNASSQDCSVNPPGCRELTEYAAALDGLTIVVPCFGDAPGSPERVCYSTPNLCTVGPDPIFSGAQPFDTTLTFGGNPGTIYDVTVHVQGQVESKVYSGGMDQSSAPSLPADGFYVGGEPSATTAANYNIYLMRVSSPAKDYFFNSISTSGDNRVRESTFDIDYEATIQIEGGATMRLVASDPNCLTTKNCADPAVNGMCTPHNFANLDASIADDIGTQPYGSQFVGFVVQAVSK